MTSTTDTAQPFEAEPHDLPLDLWLIWADGFHHGVDRMMPAIAQAEADRDRYYYLLHNTAEVQARHRDMLKGFDVALARRTDAEKWAELDRIAAARAAKAEIS